MSGRIVAVGGASSPIGRALAERLTCRGDELLPDGPDLTDRAAERGRLDLLVVATDDAAHTATGARDVAGAARALDELMLAPVALVRALWPLLVASRGGVIVVSSAQGTYAAPSAPAVAAAQTALTGWSRVLRSAGLREGVAVLTLHPGPAAEPGRVADVALRTHARGRGEVWIPASGRLVAAAQSLAPGLFARRLAR